MVVAYHHRFDPARFFVGTMAMNRRNIGILSITAGFLLVWGGATGRLGNAWGALVRGGSASSTPSSPSSPDASSDNAGNLLQPGDTTGDGSRQCPPGTQPDGRGKCVPIAGGMGQRRMMTKSLATNGVMAWSHNGSV